MRVLFATTVLPGGRGSGGEVASSAVIDAIRDLGHSVTVVGYRRRGAPANAAEGEVSAGARDIETSAAGPRAVPWVLSALARGLPYSLAKYRGRRYLRVLRAELARTSPDLVIVDHAQLAWVTDALGGTPYAYLAHNVEHQLYAEAADGGRSPRDRMNARESREIERVERRLVAAAEAVWALSADDAAALCALGARRDPLVLRLPPAFAGVDGEDEAPRLQDVGLLGTWTWEPNALGLRWFAERVMPQIPSVDVAVAGLGGAEIVAGSPARPLGRVPDAGGFLAGSGVIAVPSVAGAGVQVKTIDAISTGRPVVATPTAIRGIADLPPTVRVAESADAFAEAIRAALREDVTAEQRAAALAWAGARRESFGAAVAAGLDSASTGAGESGLRCAYIASRYPYVSHTFILREVLALRDRGARIETFTVRRPDPADVIAPVDHEEHDATTPILPTSLSGLAGAHARAMRRGPRAYLATLFEALGDVRVGLRSTTWQLFYFAEAVLFWDRLERRGLRHVHAHHANVAADLAMIATRLARRQGARSTWSLTVHGPADFEAANERTLSRKAGRADAVVAISEFARERLMAVTDPARHDRIAVIHCGVDPDDYRVVPAASASGTDAPGPLRVLTVSRLEERKGHAILLRAVAELHREGSQVRLEVIGDGPERSRLTELAAELGIGGVVTFAGALGHGEVTARYGEADVFCLASFAEGVPIVLMEAMASGLPVVATSIAGVPELVEDGRSGLLVPPGRVEDLAGALALLEADPETRTRLALAGRQRVLDDFTLADSAAELERLLLRASGSAGAQRPRPA